LRKQPTKYSIRTLLLPNGERLPVLRDRATGEPVYEPTLYASVYLRSKNVAALTIEQALRSVIVVLLTLEALSIDLTARLRRGHFLELREVDAVVSACKLPLHELQSEDDETKVRSAKVVKLESYRSAAKRPSLKEVYSQTAALRIYYIRDYLKWRAQHALLNFSLDNDTHARLEKTARVIDSALAERAPVMRRRNTVGRREGLSSEAVNVLASVIRVDSSENPWSPKSRERNNLIVRWLVETGLRRGELLNMAVEDIDWRSNEVLIVRRPDNPEDARRNQPLVKTRDRLVPISPDLARDTHAYVMGARRRLPGARKHGHLFVARSTGAALSLSALNLVFVQLRKKCDALPNSLSPHRLRHTWNDGFSEYCDRTGVSEEKEKQMRSALMGWSNTSNASATYTKRHVRRKADEVSRAMQHRMLQGK
jgi:integrase